VLGGADALRGVLEIAGSAAVGAATRLAVAEALAAVVGRASPKGTRSSIEVTRSPPKPGAFPGALRFAYAVRFTDRTAVALGRRALEREAADGGRRRLLPRFAAALRAHGHGPTPAGELRIVDFSVEAFAVPGKGEGAAPGGLSALSALAVAGNADVLESVVRCLQEHCGNGEFSGYDHFTLDGPPHAVQAGKRRRQLSQE